VASLQRTISNDPRTYASLRWLGSSLDWLLRAVRLSRFCHVFMTSPDWARSRRMGLPIDLLAVVSHCRAPQMAHDPRARNSLVVPVTSPC